MSTLWSWDYADACYMHKRFQNPAIRRNKGATMTPKAILASAAAVAAMSAASFASADEISYPNAGMYNSAVYAFTASASEDITGYIVGGFGAGFENQVGLLDNGVLTAAGYGLDNHSSSEGDSFDFGPVTAGDTLTFVLHNLSLNKNAYSNPALNVGYDEPGDTIGHNHVYSTAYTATSPVFDGVPTGTYLAFEDLPFPNSDFNYDDESFVFTNTTETPVSAAPEPSAWALMIAGVGVMGAALRLGRRREDMAGSAA